MTEKLPFLGLIVLVASACAGSSKQRTATTDADSAVLAGRSTKTDQKNKADNTLVCEMERVVGSNIPQRVCYNREDLEQSRIQTQNALDLRPTPSGVKPN